MEVERVGVALTDQNFQTTVLESPKPVLVAFWAEGCGPWHMLARRSRPWPKRFEAG